MLRFVLTVLVQGSYLHVATAVGGGGRAQHSVDGVILIGSGFVSNSIKIRQIWLSYRMLDMANSLLTSFLTIFYLTFVMKATGTSLALIAFLVLGSFNHAYQRDSAQRTLHQLNAICSTFEATINVKTSDSFKITMLIWDTRASFDLTPFCQDFIDYVQVEMPVKDVTKVNTVIGVGTAFFKFVNDWKEIIYLHCIAYHLPTLMYIFSACKHIIRCMVERVQLTETLSQ